MSIGSMQNDLMEMGSCSGSGMIVVRINVMNISIPIVQWVWDDSGEGDSNEQ
jgi:hypothetical protein